MRTIFAALVAVTFSTSAALACDHDPNGQTTTNQSSPDQNKKKTTDAKSDKDKKAPAKDERKS